MSEIATFRVSFDGLRMTIRTCFQELELLMHGNQSPRIHHAMEDLKMNINNLLMVYDPERKDDCDDLSEYMLE